MSLAYLASALALSLLFLFFNIHSFPTLRNARGLARTACVSPLVYVLFCRAIDLGLGWVLGAIGFAQTQTVFLVIRVCFMTLVHLAAYVFSWVFYRRYVNVSGRLAFLVYSAFLLVTVAPLCLTEAWAQPPTAALLAALAYLLFRGEIRFALSEDGRFRYVYYALYGFLFYTLIVGLMGVNVLPLEGGSGIVASEDTQAWIQVIAVFLPILTFLILKLDVHGQRELVNARRTTELVTGLNRDLVETQDQLIQSFSEILEGKSGQSGNHVKRVSKYAALIAQAMGLDEETVHVIGVAAMMHDCGKLMIPNEILEKPGRLTDEEFARMREHVAYGEQMLMNVPGRIMHEAMLVASQHHERWDGKGYLNHLAGEDIALSSQIVAVADVFDALTSKRCYKDAWDVDEARDEILKNRGTQFSPRAVDAFAACYEDCLRVMRELRD